MTIWCDTSGLRAFFQTARRPTGIQRLNFEILRALAAHDGVAFCHRERGGWCRTDFAALAAGILATASTAAPQRRAAAAGYGGVAGWARTLPPDLRLPLGRLARAGAQGAVACKDLALAGAAYLLPRAASQAGTPITLTAGDWLINLGASWDHAYTPAELTAWRANGAKIGLFVHDLIAALHPEWCTQGTITDITAWLAGIVPQADLLFANSRQTQADFARVMGKGAKIPVVLPMGCNRMDSALAAAPRNEVLMVGSLEVRKNHVSLLHVWRRLLAALPVDEVPKLVFAGKIGWLTGDFLQALDNANWLGGKIQLVESPAEPELAALYQSCRFTIFPSLYEGFGLPVTESLAHGKMVAASDRPAIREAGGDFCAYFDPENISSITETVTTLLDPARLAAMEARIAAAFRPLTWENTASAMLAALGGFAP
jgi:glycosyltransferase involved in cell wall biosynthesis